MTTLIRDEHDVDGIMLARACAAGYHRAVVGTVVLRRIIAVGSSIKRSLGKPRVWVGADPGGKGAFGVAIIGDGKEPQSVLVDCAAQAIAFLRDALARPASGVGVDAPLWWSSGRSSDRHADQWLRKRYSLTGGRVQAANSLRGAALVQAAMFVHGVRELFPDVPVTEAHPKVLLKAVARDSWRAFSRKYQIHASAPVEHVRDAMIAAVAAREGVSGRWSNDLALERLPDEQDPFTYWLRPVHYYWPE